MTPKTAVTSSSAVEKPKRKRIRRIQHNNLLSREESLRREKPIWLRPFREKPIDRALAYLEDLRKLCEDAGHILNERISQEKDLRCSGPGCGRSLDGLQPNGMPKWINKTDVRDKNHPEIIRPLYFCSELCWNGWMRSKGPNAGAHGNLSPTAKTV